MGSPYKTVAFQTLGCKLNFAETSTLARDFTSLGYAKVAFTNPADVYVINTCSVTENANRKARKAVRRALRQSPEAIIALVGCYAQLHPDEIAQIPGVKIVLGAEEKFNLAEHIEANQFNGKPVVLNSAIETVNKFITSFSIGERTRSFLKVQDGCNYNCSFCTIPLARGRSRSGSIVETINQAQQIAQSEIREVVLTGVNVGDFGTNREESLLDLIQELEKVEGIDRYRISSIEPNLLTDEIIEFMAHSHKFLPHFHIPLQSGSNKILKAMRRRYKTLLYADRIRKIKFLMLDAGIGVDVIVGFPGESDEDFQQTFDFIQNLDVSYLHVFSFSERDNTDALKINPKLPPDVIAERSRILHHLSNQKRHRFFQQNLGQVRQVLTESWEEGILTGLTDNYIPVKLSGTAQEVNQIISLSLTEINNGQGG